MKHEITTARTLLRPLTADDAIWAHAVFSDPEVMRYAAGEPDVDIAATMTRIERYARLQAQHGFSKWAVVDRRSGDYLGDAGLTVVPETGEIELGYRFGKSHWGRGLATEVAEAWLRHALGPLALPRIIAFADPQNPASIRVMEKIGMKYERRDHLVGLDCVVHVATQEEARP